MLTRLTDVLDSAQLEDVRKLMSGGRFVDGVLSAGRAAQRVKNNQELDKQSAEIEALNNLKSRHKLSIGQRLRLPPG